MIENIFRYFLVPYPVSDEIKQVVIWQFGKDDYIPNENGQAIVKMCKKRPIPEILKNNIQITAEYAAQFGRQETTFD